jgi:hypothetical protein
VNVLSPGPTATPGLLESLASAGQGDALIAGLIAQTLIGRVGLPEETAGRAFVFAPGLVQSTFEDICRDLPLEAFRDELWTKTKERFVLSRLC